MERATSGPQGNVQLETYDALWSKKDDREGSLDIGDTDDTVKRALNGTLSCIPSNSSVRKNMTGSNQVSKRSEVLLRE